MELGTLINQANGVKPTAVVLLAAPRMRALQQPRRSPTPPRSSLAGLVNVARDAICAHASIYTPRFVRPPRCARRRNQKSVLMTDGRPVAARRHVCCSGSGNSRGPGQGGPRARQSDSIGAPSRLWPRDAPGIRPPSRVARLLTTGPAVPPSLFYAPPFLLFSPTSPHSYMPG